jgi:hypothetical protein
MLKDWYKRVQTSKIQELHRDVISPHVHKLPQHNLGGPPVDVKAQQHDRYEHR